MAYQSGKTYYLIPTCEVLSTNDVNNILNKKKQPHALNTKGTGGHYNNRDCNLWTLDYSTSNCQAKCNSLVEKINRRNKAKTFSGAIVNQIKNNIKALS